LTNLIKVSPLLVIAAMALTKFNWHNIVDFYNISGKTNWQALSGAATVTLFAFVGMEAAVVPSNDMVSHRVIARATIIGTLLVSLFYVFVTLGLLGFSPASEVKNMVSPFQSIGVGLLGTPVKYWIVFCAILTILGSVNGGIVIFAQDAMAAAQHSILPKIFGDTNNRFNTPIKGIFISGIVMTLLLLLTIDNSLQKQFNFLILLCTLSLLIPYFVSATAAMLLLVKKPTKLPTKQFSQAFMVALLASIYAFWMMIGAGQEVVFYGCLFFFAVFWLHLIYAFIQRKSQVDLLKQDGIE
jgi:basic amino acid/polyamine antiporter, APA family